MSQPPPSQSHSDLRPANGGRAHQGEGHPARDLDVKTYVEQMLCLQQIAVPAEQLADIVESFERVRAIAQPVLDFPLPDSIESAPRFEP